MLELLALLWLAAQQPPPDGPPPGDGPRGTSQAFGTARYDAVGYASWYGSEAGTRTASGARFDPDAITAAHNSLPMGSFAEVTALDSGRTIVVLITDRGPHAGGRLIDLSRGAARLLGTDRTSVAAVRVRAIDPPPADQSALRAGKAASARLDASPQLLAALRRRLGAQPRPSARGADPAPVATSAPATAAPAGLLVQVASFSNADRARALAATFHGSVGASGGVYRVYLGPFTSRAEAEAARAAAVQRGYGDARLVQQ